MIGLLALLSGVVLHSYAAVYTPPFGWTKLIFFGSELRPDCLPRVQNLPHYEDPDPGGRFGYDGQYYAQMAIDPTLRDPKFDQALDNPTYRGRRIGLPAVAFVLGGGNPASILQIYALANLGFWFLLLGVMAVLLRPWTTRQLLGLGAGMLSYGVISSMQRSLVDLPAATIILLGVTVGRRWEPIAMAAALLTRETSALAAVGGFDWLAWWRERAWKKAAGTLVVVFGPLALWMLYVHHRFPGQTSGGTGNFSWPFAAMYQAGWENLQHWKDNGGRFAPGHFARLFAESRAKQQVLGSVALLSQAVYLGLRRDLRSPGWRIGVCYLPLWVVLGPAVWIDVSQVARVLLPLTLCFYLRVTQEPARWFWPFFVLGSLSIPMGVHKFWTMS